MTSACHTAPARRVYVCDRTDLSVRQPAEKQLHTLAEGNAVRGCAVAVPSRRLALAVLMQLVSPPLAHTHRVAACDCRTQTSILT